MYIQYIESGTEKVVHQLLIGVRKKCFLAIQHDAFPQFPDCKFIRTSSLCSGCLIVKSDIAQDLLKLVSSHCFTKAHLWKVRNCYFLVVLLQQPCISEYSTESSYPEVLEKHLLKYQHDCE